jgi:hypothetical protein
MSVTARDELRVQIDEHKAKIAEARARDRVRRERYSAALQAAEQAVREHAARVLPCERFGHIPEPPQRLIAWPAEPAAEVQDTRYSAWLVTAREVADASLEASVQQIEQVQAETVARLNQVARCAKCRVFFRCLALTWLFRK